MLEKEGIAKQWLETDMILLYKKGPKDRIQNYHQISLIPLYIKYLVNTLDTFRS